MTDTQELRRRLGADPERTLIVTDFDGTLAPIVTDPAAARPIEGAPEALERLAARFGIVAVVSGRPLDFLHPLIPPSVVVAGLYGLEQRQGDRRVVDDRAGAWREAVVTAVASARRDLPPAVRIEDKGLSMTVHFREAPEHATAAEAWAAAQARECGLEPRAARQSVELHPPLPIDKGTVVEELARRVPGGRPAAACFAGDDRGDLAAFDALDRLARAGAATTRIGVRSTESPDELLTRADVVVDGPGGFMAVIEALLEP